MNAIKRNLIITLILLTVCICKTCNAETILNSIMTIDKDNIGEGYKYLYIRNDTYYLVGNDGFYYMKNGEKHKIIYPEDIINNYQPQWRFSTGDFAVPIGGNGIFVMFLQTNIPTINKTKGVNAEATYIFDSNFNVINRFQQSGEIIDMFFQDGYFYFTTEEMIKNRVADYNTYRTIDFSYVEKCNNIRRKLLQKNRYYIDIEEQKQECKIVIVILCVI